MPHSPSGTHAPLSANHARHSDAPRYVQITLEQDLLGGWTLYRESGTQGGRATMKREQYLERDEAVSAFEKARDAQLKRGFRLMFAQGLEGPYGR